MSHARDAEWEVRVFFDGRCPLCKREIDWLRQRTPEGRADFVDFTDPSFDAASTGLGYDALMGRIHGQLPDGTIIEGVEVFQRLYTAAGLGRLVAPTRWPGFDRVTRAAYEVFARNRLWITGRAEEGAGHGTCDTAGDACAHPASGQRS